MGPQLQSARVPTVQVAPGMGSASHRSHVLLLSGRGPMRWVCFHSLISGREAETERLAHWPHVATSGLAPGLPCSLVLSKQILPHVV